MEDSRNLQENPSAIIKIAAMILPTPSKIEITSKNFFPKVNEIEEEDSEATERQKIETEKGLVEVGSKKMKDKIQGPAFEIQESSFLETQEEGKGKRFPYC